MSLLSQEAIDRMKQNYIDQQKEFYRRHFRPLLAPGVDIDGLVWYHVEAPSPPLLRSMKWQIKPSILRWHCEADNINNSSSSSDSGSDSKPVNAKTIWRARRELFIDEKKLAADYTKWENLFVKNCLEMSRCNGIEQRRRANRERRKNTGKKSNERLYETFVEGDVPDPMMRKGTPPHSLWVPIRRYKLAKHKEDFSHKCLKIRRQPETARKEIVYKEAASCFNLWLHGDDQYESDEEEESCEKDNAGKEVEGEEIFEKNVKETAEKNSWRTRSRIYLRTTLAHPQLKKILEEEIFKKDVKETASFPSLLATVSKSKTTRLSRIHPRTALARPPRLETILEEEEEEEIFEKDVKGTAGSETTKNSRYVCLSRIHPCTALARPPRRETIWEELSRLQSSSHSDMQDYPAWWVE